MEGLLILASTWEDLSTDRVIQKACWAFADKYKPPLTTLDLIELASRSSASPHHCIKGGYLSN